MHRYGSRRIIVLSVITSRDVNTVTDQLIKEIKIQFLGADSFS